MVEHALDWVGGQWRGGEVEGVAWEASPARLWGGPEIGGMLQQAMDALDLGLLVLAPLANMRATAPHLVHGHQR